MLANENKFSTEVLDGLKSELPTYLAIPEDTAVDINLLVWWNNMGTKFLHGLMLARRFFFTNPLLLVWRW